ncbi:MAG TPA: vitamin B12 dependent-methionine synthase activation domain-containing protein [Opitutaceae bacterium]|nr:vitamin B12 dependent-methionine synthase activation domain-containing protein [Opitutaceae bacterium]
MPARSTSPAAPPAAPPPAPLTSETCDPLPLTPRREDIYRCLGYARRAAPPADVAREIDRVVAEALPHLQPRGTYSLYPLDGPTEHSLAIGGLVLEGNIGEFLHGATRVAVFVATAGGAITRRADERCRAGDAFAGWVLDAIGSWAAEAAAEALLARLDPHLQPDEGRTLPYSPGYCGMELAEQRKLFRLMRADAAGVALLPSLLMEPLKSVSGLVGLGPRALVRTDLTPCDRCPLVGCHMRR